MQRRELLKAGLVAGVAPLAAAGARAAQSTPRGSAMADAAPAPFKLNYAPHLGMFTHHAGKDPIDQLRFMADEGFRAFEDNGMAGRDVALQDKLGAELDRLGMTMGVFVAYADFGQPSFVTEDMNARRTLLEHMRRAVEVAARVNARWCTVVPGALDPRAPPGFQTARCIDNLRRCCEVLEPAGLTMVLEPLNRRDHPGLFLSGIPQAYAICRAVDSPACKILDDLYHQQITEGDLIPNMDAAWGEIAYFQVGDNPGRKEPTTGEINYRNVFRHIHARGFDGVVGMEHGNSRGGKEGERAVIDAYREVDA